MAAYRITLSATQTPDTCGRIGGSPGLPVGSDWPHCRLCDAEMVAFADVVLPQNSPGTFRAGSRIQIFACREHDDIAGTPFSGYSRFAEASRRNRLPADYWLITDGHYLIRFVPPSVEVSQSQRETRLLAQFVNLSVSAKDDADGFKLFGTPYWLQDPEPHLCSCGAPMELLIQIPDGQGFPMTKDAEEQPNSFSATQYCIFLGNQLYLFGCAQQCHPLALWPILQN